MTIKNEIYPEAYSEMSKRIDATENDIYILRERYHQHEETRGVVVAAIERISDQLLTVFENQDKLSEKMINSFEDISSRFEKIEETTNTFKIVTSHWKVIIWTIIISCVIGFAFDNGIKDILHVIAGDKAAKAAQTIIVKKS